MTDNVKIFNSSIYMHAWYTLVTENGDFVYEEILMLSKMNWNSFGLDHTSHESKAT